ncbi:unnamed protein product [Clavelina lepadiformis]|uniref:CDP-diacylglycerol--glycerol-3-phosphate 3-phosphatidyltransferase n=1 Tax=Clavelina lepadiformis TaxID=159417 RepID=A0ABP0F7B2_CLALP
MDCVSDKGSLHDYLELNTPCFAVQGENIKVLNSPSEFYCCLIDGIMSAKRRIVLSALYLGTGEKEEKLVQCLDEALHRSVVDNRSLDVSILFDYVRGSRGSKNSKTILLPLLKHHDSSAGTNKLEVSFYHTPSLRGAWKQFLPARFNEVIGLNHLKIFIFDDTFIISGANLSTEYFHQRQDRYMQFNNCNLLANHFQTLVKAVSSFSFQLQSDGSLKFSEQCPYHPFNGNYSQFISFANRSLQSLLNPYQSVIASDSNAVIERQPGLFSSVFSSAVYLLQAIGFMKENKNNRDVAFTESNGAPQHRQEHSDPDTFIFPTLQMGIAGVRQDERVTKLLLESFPSKSHVCFTSGYFNITDDYSNAVLSSSANFDILTASPEANGFLGASGFAGNIPAVYIYFTRLFFEQLTKNESQKRIKIWEYMQPQWTYHAKGIWFCEEGQSLPSATMIGSSNFGLRSVNRDLEAQVILITKNRKLMEQLQTEKANLLKWSKPVTPETFAQPRYFVPRWVCYVSNLIKHYF